MKNLELAKDLSDTSKLTGITVDVRFSVVYPFMLGLKLIVTNNTLPHWDGVTYTPGDSSTVTNVLTDSEYKNTTGNDRFVFVTKVTTPNYGNLSNNIYYDRKNSMFFMVPDLSMLLDTSIIGNKHLILDGVIIGYISNVKDQINIDSSFSVADSSNYLYKEPKSNIGNTTSLVTVYGLNYGNNNKMITYTEKSVTTSAGFTDNIGVQYNQGDPTVVVDLGTASDIFSDTKDLRIAAHTLVRSGITTYNTVSVGLVDPKDEHIYLFIRF
jgi:hypothetical protein